MLQFLHLAAVAGVRVVRYTDSPVGRLTVERDGGGRFDEVVLHPSVGVEGVVDAAQLDALHERSHELCFVARSVNFPVRHEAVAAEAAR
jgi:organic hydroperoxide reductase OsmC/OhrA